MRSSSIFLCGLLIFANAAHAQPCSPPEPLDRSSDIRGSVVFAESGGNHCDIITTLAANNDPTASAFVWYSLPEPNPGWRISFRLDTSRMGEVHDLVDSVAILNANARQPYPAVDGVAALLGLMVFPSSGAATAPSLWAALACTSQPSLVCVTKLAEPLIDGDLFRFELNVGDGNQGSLRWWINADFDDAPTGSVHDLDNAAWSGVQTVALGAFQPSGRLRLNGTELRFYEVETVDDTLFWNGFENQ